MKDRYLKKLETFEKEREFIEGHTMADEVSERALLYALQICVEAAMDMVAMKVKDAGLVVEDDYTNIEKLVEDKIITARDGDLLKQFNGLRNAIAHRYDKLDMAIVKGALERVDELSDVVVKVVG
jgi:uncharacterized protein YutE (UPF0331/DUF86 family)